MGLPNPSRATKFSGANEDREHVIFPVQLVDHEQDCQPYPVDSYTEVNRARMCLSPHKNIPGTWYINKCKQQYICTYHDESARTLNFPVELTTSRFGNLTRLFYITLL